MSKIRVKAAKGRYYRIPRMLWRNPWYRLMLSSSRKISPRYRICQSDGTSFVYDYQKDANQLDLGTVLG